MHSSADICPYDELVHSVERFFLSTLQCSAVHYLHLPDGFNVFLENSRRNKIHDDADFFHILILIDVS